MPTHGRLRDGEADPHARASPSTRRSSSSPRTRATRRRSPTAYASGAVDFIFAPIVPDVLRAKVSVFVELFLQVAGARAVAERRHALSERSATARRAPASVLENVADGIVTLGEDGLIESFNRAAERLFGYSEDEAVGQPFAMMIAPEHAGDFAEPARRAELLRAEHAGRVAETVGCRKDGSTLPDGARPQRRAARRAARPHRLRARHLRAQGLHRGAGAPGAARRRSPACPTASLFGDRVDHAIRAAPRDDEPLRRAGASTSTASSRSTTRSATSTATCCSSWSPSGSSAACATATPSPASAATSSASCPPAATDLARRRRRSSGRSSAALEPAVRDRRATRSTCSASIGIALVPEHGDNIDDLLRRADLAMYDAKRLGSGYARVRRRAGGRAGAPARAARRPAPLHRARRARPALPAEDRPRDAARRSASRRWSAGTTRPAGC